MAGSHVNGKWFYVLSFITTMNFSCVALLCDINPVQLSLEVQMIVFATIGIEGWSAIRALIIWIHVFINCQFRFTNSAKDCFCVPLVFIPYLCRMISCFFMTLIAGVIFVTTFEFYGNNVKEWTIMLATGFIIYNLSIYLGRIHITAKVRNDLRKKKFL